MENYLPLHLQEVYWPFTSEIIVCGITQNEICFCSLIIGSEMVKLNVFEMPDESEEW